MSEEIQIDSKKYKIGEFEGPLDLLLFLIKKNEVNIYDIPIAEITEQYIEYISYAAKIDLDNITEFYLMAATLLYIKSCLLLPIEMDLDDDLEDPRKELVEKLIDYQKYKKLGELMTETGNEMENFVERKKNQLSLPFEQDDLWEEISVWDLLNYFSSIVSNLSSERVIDFYEEVTINEKITLINEFLEEKGEFDFKNLIKNEYSYLEIVCAFIALLELVKSKYIKIYQNKIFGEIQIRKNEINGERN